MSLQTHEVNISTLKPATYNPRSWSEKQIEDLKTSVEKFGLVEPILVNSAKKRNGIVIGGHFRLKIAKDLGYKKVPVVYLDIPDENKEKELNLRLNKNTGSFDLELLQEFDPRLILDVGFDDSDLGSIWDDQLDLASADTPISKKHEKKEAICQSGDIYKLGTHSLICGDATDPQVYKKIIGKEKIDFLFCDPPYNIGYSYTDGLTTQGKYQGSKTEDDKSDHEYESFLSTVISNALEFARDDLHVGFWCDQKYVGLIQEIYKKHEIDFRRTCLWIKGNFTLTPKVAFNKAYEPMVYGVRGSPYLNEKATKYNEVLNTQIENGNRGIDDILDLLDIWMVKRVNTQDYIHPTQKPMNLYERPLKRCTKPGDNILDCFGGGGTTLMACEQLGRTCFLIEHDPIFCDAIIDRFISLFPQHDIKKMN